MRPALGPDDGPWLMYIMGKYEAFIKQCNSVGGTAEISVNEGAKLTQKCGQILGFHIHIYI